MHVHQRPSSTGIGARVVAGIVMASTLVMGGCVDPVGVAPTPIATPSPTFSSPVFASDEEALAAAEAAYAEYLAMSDLIAQEGGVNPERIVDVAVDDLVEISVDGAREFQLLGYRTVGTSTFRDVQLQSVDEISTHLIVTVYLCNDISNVDVLDASGESVVPESRANTTRLRVELIATPPDFDLRVSTREPWGEGSC